MSKIKATVNTGSTESGCEFLRLLPLEKMYKVQIIPDGCGFVKVSFYFELKRNTMQIDMSDSFCVGYNGEGPNGLYDILIEGGFPEETALKVFEISRYEETTLTK